MADSNIVKWFWQAVETFDEERRARLLQFVTGSTRVPLQGFKALQGDWCGGWVNLWLEKGIKVVWYLQAPCKISAYDWISQALANFRAGELFYICQQLSCCWALWLLLIVMEAGGSVTVQCFDCCQFWLVSLLQLCALRFKSFHANMHRDIWLTKELFRVRIVFPSVFSNKPLGLKANFWKLQVFIKNVAVSLAVLISWSHLFADSKLMFKIKVLVLFYKENLHALKYFHFWWCSFINIKFSSFPKYQSVKWLSQTALSLLPSLHQLQISLQI